jgi:urease alpha subunit
VLALQDGIAVALKIHVQGRGSRSYGYTPLSAHELKERLIPVITEREHREANILHNGLAPHRKFDLTIYEVRAGGELLLCNPAPMQLMAQRYFLF